MSFEFNYSSYGIPPERAEALQKETSQAAPAETYGESQARREYEQAAAHLERVKTVKDAAGQLRHSYKDRFEAEQALKVKEKEMWAAQNEGAKQRRIAAREAVKAAEQAQAAARNEALRATQEADLQRQLRAVYMGSDEEFKAAWPLLKQEYYNRQALNQLDVDRAQMQARYGGAW
jgi:hypothetical protein